MSEFTQDEHTVLLIAGKDQNMIAIGRWEKPVKDLTARGFLRMLDPVNFVITPAGRAALEREELAENKALAAAFTRPRPAELHPDTEDTDKDRREFERLQKKYGW